MSNKKIFSLLILITLILLVIGTVSATSSNQTDALDEIDESSLQTSCSDTANLQSSASDNYDSEPTTVTHDTNNSSSQKSISTESSSHTSNITDNSYTQSNSKTDTDNKNISSTISNKTATSTNNIKEETTNDNITNLKSSDSINTTNQNSSNYSNSDLVSNKSLTTSSITKDVNNYEELYDTIEEFKTSSSTELTVNLNEGNYNITSRILLSENNEQYKVITINGNNQTINGSNTYSFMCLTGNYDVNLNNITFVNCKNLTRYNGDEYQAGGILFSDNGNITITSCTFINNYGASGGAIHSIYGNITIINSTFINNKAEKLGGAIYHSNSNLKLINTTFENNTADYGGALYSDGIFSIENTTFTNNTAGYSGGAIYYDIYGSRSNITDTNFTGNTATWGGAIFHDGRNLTIEKSSFINNQATTGDGGAICSYENLTINNTTFINNTGSNGGAIYNNNQFGIMEITYSTFIDNYATSTLKEAINNFGTLRLRYNNFSYNNAEYGAVYLYSGNSSFTIDDNTMELPTVYKSIYESTPIYAPIADVRIETRSPVVFQITNSSGKTEKVNAIIQDDLAVLDYNFEYGDSYNVFVNYTDYSYFQRNNISFTVDLKERNTSITVDVIEQKKDMYITVTGLLTVDDKPISNENITITINNESYTTTTNNQGEYAYNYSVTPGTYDIKVNYSGNLSHPPCNNSMTYNVTKIETVLQIDSINNITVGNTVTISGTLKDIYGNILGDSNIILYVNDLRNSLRTDNDGFFTYNYTTTKGGVNNITAVYDETSLYASTETTKTFNVIRINTEITVDPINDLTVYDGLTISGIVKDQYGNVVPDITVRIRINDIESGIYTNSYGEFSYYTWASMSETNYVTVTVVEDDIYSSSSNSTTFYVTKLNTQITINPIEDSNIITGAPISGKITNSQERSFSGNLTILINGKKDTTSFGNGGSFYYFANSTITPGINNVTITFEGDNFYTSSSASTTFFVSKEASQIVISPVTTKNGYVVSLNASICDEDGNPIDFGEATFKLNGNTIKIDGKNIKVNVVNGTAEYNFAIPNYSAKEYKLTAVYGYLDIRLEYSTTLTIIKSDPELQLTSITSDGTTGRITGMLLDEHGVGVDRDTKVSVKINGKTILSTRIYDGIIDLTFDTSAYKDGVHNLTVIFGENGCYNTVTYEGAIAQNVKDTIVVNPVTGKNGDTVSFKAYVIDENGNSATSGSATFKLNGVTVKENGTQIKVKLTNGVAEYNFTIPDYSAKDYNLTAVASVGTTRYEAQSVLTIEKTDTHVQLNPITITQGSTTTVTGTILDEHNNPITIDTKVSVKINNKTVSNTRVYDGIIDVPIDTSSYSTGTYTVEFIAGENGRYNKSTGSTTLTIN